MKPARPLEPYLLLLPTPSSSRSFSSCRSSWPPESLYSWDLLTPRPSSASPTTAALGAGELSARLLATLAYSAVVVAGAIVLGLALALVLDRPGGSTRSSAARCSAPTSSRGSPSRCFGCGCSTPTPASSRGSSVASALPKITGSAIPRVALWTLAVVSIWKIAGYSMVVFLAGLQDVPRFSTRRRPSTAPAASCAFAT